MRRLGLAPFSLREPSHPETAYLRPLETIRAAAAAGLDAVGIFVVSGTGAELMPVANDRTLRGKVRGRLDGDGVEVVYVECLYLEPTTDFARLEPVFEAAAELGAKELLCIGMDPDGARLIQGLQDLAGRCDPFGLRVNLEFFPASEVKTLAAAADIAHRTGRADLGIVVDTLHLHRSGGTVDDLRGIDPRRIHFIHLCDGVVPAPRPAGLAADSRDRRYPGEGGLALSEYLAALPDASPLMLECPVVADAGVPVEERAKRAATAARTLYGIRVE